MREYASFSQECCGACVTARGISPTYSSAKRSHAPQREVASLGPMKAVCEAEARDNPEFLTAANTPEPAPESQANGAWSVHLTWVDHPSPITGLSKRTSLARKALRCRIDPPGAVRAGLEAEALDNPEFITSFVKP